MFNKSVDSITKVFTKAIKDLEALEIKFSTAIGNNDVKIRDLQLENVVSKAEIQRSAAVRTKLQSIVA